MNTEDNHRLPVNKQASLFLSRPKRVETVKDALDRLAEMILSPDVADNLVEMMKTTDGEGSVKMEFEIHRDHATPDCFAVRMNTSICRRLGKSGYFGLK